MFPTRMDASCNYCFSYSFALGKEGGLYLIVKVVDFFFNRVQGFFFIKRKQEDDAVYELHPALIFEALERGRV